MRDLQHPGQCESYNRPRNSISPNELYALATVGEVVPRLYCFEFVLMALRRSVRLDALDGVLSDIGEGLGVVSNFLLSTDVGGGARNV